MSQTQIVLQSRFFYGHSSMDCCLSTDESYIHCYSQISHLIPKRLKFYPEKFRHKQEKSATTRNKYVRSSRPLLSLLPPVQSALVPESAFLQMVPPFTQDFGIHPCSSLHLCSPHPLLFLSPSPLHSHGLCL